MALTLLSIDAEHLLMASAPWTEETCEVHAEGKGPVFEGSCVNISGRKIKFFCPSIEDWLAGEPCQIDWVTWGE